MADVLKIPFTVKSGWSRCVEMGLGILFWIDSGNKVGVGEF